MITHSPPIVRWEFIGALVTILAGSALHFVFDWTGGWRPAAIIVAVNESIWEHLKLAFWPGLFWALLPQEFSELSLWERLAIKGFTLITSAILIVVIFKCYTAILGRNILLLDIGTFVVAIVAGQGASAWLNIHGLRYPPLIAIGLTLLVLQIAAFACFTIFPPDFWLFTDSRNGLRGLP